MLAAVIALLPPPLPTLPATFGSGRDGGLDTATVAFPATLVSAEGIGTVIAVEVLPVGAANCPCEPPRVQITVETCCGVVFVGPVRKLVPLIVRERPLPTVAQVGETEVTVGTGLGGFSMIKVRVLERPLFPVPEAGLMVLMLAVPGLEMSEAGILAVTDVTTLLASRVIVVVHELVDAVVEMGQVLPFH